MKSIISLAIAAAIAFSGSAVAQSCCSPASKKGHQSGTDGSWKIYGSKLTLEEVTPLSEALSKLETSSSGEILVCGEVAEVCQGKGCWMVVVCGDSHVRVEFKDYEFFVPWDSEGKKVKLQGRLEEKKITSAAAKHMVEEMKFPPVKKEDIEDENVITVFVASAVAMEGGSEIGEEQRAIIEGKKEHGSGEHKH